MGTEIKNVFIIEANLKAALAGVQEFKEAAKSTGQEVPQAFAPATEAVKKHSKEVSGLTQFVREGRTEQRLQTFLFRESREAIGALSLGLAAFSNATGESNSSMKKFSAAANEGFVTFQGLSFALTAVPYGTLIAGFAGVFATFFKFNETAKGSTDVLRSHKDAVEALITVYDAWSEKMKDGTNATGQFTKEQLALTQANASILQQQINKYREYVDEVVNGEKIQFTFAGMTTETRKKGVEALAEVNKKYLQQSQAFQVAYNNAVKDGKNEEEAKTEGIKAAKIELQGLLDKQAGYIAALNQVTIVGNTNKESIRSQAAVVANLEKEFDNTAEKINGKMNPAFIALREQLREAKLKLEEMKETLSSLAEPPAMNQLGILASIKESFKQGHEAVASFKKEMKGIFGEGGNEEQMKIVAKLELDMSQVEQSTKTELEIVDEWEKKTQDALDVEQAAFEVNSNDWKRLEDDKTRVTEIAAKRRSQLELAETKKTVAALASGFRQVYGLIQEAGQQSSQARIDGINEEKDSALKAYDLRFQAELNNDNTTEERKKQILDGRAALEKSYEDKVKAEKLRAWEADKDAKRLQAVIDTASAIVEAAPNPFLMALAAAVGAAQIAIISSTPPPKFAKGGSFVVPDGFPNDSFPLPAAMLSSRERVTVETEEQQQAPRNISFHFNIHTAVGGRQFVMDAAKQLKRETGLTFEELTRNNHSILQIGKN